MLGQTIVVKQYGLQRTGTNALRALLQEHVPGTLVLMHVLGDKHSPPVDLSEALDAVRRHPQPALAFVTLASRLAPAYTTAIDRDERQRAHLAAVANEVFDAARAGHIRVVVSIRDPYDWARAVLRWTDALPVDAPRAVELLVPGVRGMCERFNTCYRAWLALVDRSRQGASVVRVEDLRGALDELLARLARELDLPYAAPVPVAAGPAPPRAGARRPTLQRRLGATRWDDAPIAVDASPDAELEERAATSEPLPDLLAAVVTDRIDWSLIERFDYRPAHAAPPRPEG